MANRRGRVNSHANELDLVVTLVEWVGISLLNMTLRFNISRMRTESAHLVSNTPQQTPWHGRRLRAPRHAISRGYAIRNTCSIETDTTLCSIPGVSRSPLPMVKCVYVCVSLHTNRVVIQTESNGDVTSCQYSQGQDCKGLCDQGIQNEFVSGGLTWGGSCAIPCVGDAEGGTGTVPAH